MVHYVQCTACLAIGTRTPIPVTCSECGGKYIPENPRYTCKFCNGVMRRIKPMEYDFLYLRGVVQHEA